jgi:hypothetical protein
MASGGYRRVHEYGRRTQRPAVVSYPSRLSTALNSHHDIKAGCRFRDLEDGIEIRIHLFPSCGIALFGIDPTLWGPEVVVGIEDAANWHWTELNVRSVDATRLARSNAPHVSTATIPHLSKLRNHQEDSYSRSSPNLNTLCKFGDRSAQSSWVRLRKKRANRLRTQSLGSLQLIPRNAPLSSRVSYLQTPVPMRSAAEIVIR